jgi:hypothetical protein
MARRKARKTVIDPPTDAGAPAPHARSFGNACIDAIPDAIACAACALAWAKPQAIPGVDLVGWAAPLFLIQVPLSLLGLYTGVSRLSDTAMPRATKAAFVLAPAAAMALLAAALLGAQALVGVLLLSATTLWRIASGQVDREAPVRGAWITYTQGVDAQGRPRRAYSASTGAEGMPPLGAARRWRVEAGHSQVMASLTAAGGLVLVALLPFVGVERIGVTPAIEAASSWSQSTVGAVVGAHYALAGGVVLFAARFLLQFEGIAPRPGSPEAQPVPRIEDDPVLREIVRKIDRNPRD